MKIAHVIDSLGWGGAQKLLLTFTEAASRRGVETLVISLKPNRSGKTGIAESLRLSGARVIELSYRKLYDPRAIPTLISLFKTEQVDIVHTHLSHSIILGSLAAKASGISTVATLHNTQTNKMGRLSLRSRVELYCLRKITSRVIAVGENVAHNYRPILMKDILDVIPNAVSLAQRISVEERNAIRSELLVAPDQVFLIAVGRLQLQKGYYDMLTAFAQVQTHQPKAYLGIVGVGGLMGPLKEFTRSLGISDHVRFLGARSDVPRLLSAADVFINSSHWEGLSIAMLEAMAAGLPVVATSVGDAEILLQSGAGVLVQEKEPNAFANALDTLIADPLRMQVMGQTAREYVEKNYSSDLWLDKLLACYALVQNNSHSPGRGK